MTDQRAEFDAYAADYYQQHAENVRLTGENPEYFAAYKVRELRLLADKMGLSSPAIFDFGSGIGNSLPAFREEFPGNPVTCGDVSSESIRMAKERFPGDEPYVEIGADRIPVPDNSYDLIFTACVFHHIDHDQHQHWLSELHRITKPGGALAIFEHNPRNPLTVRAVNTCPFDKNAVLCWPRALTETVKDGGWQSPQVSYHLFVPRALVPLRPVERYLKWLGIGGQYMLTADKS